MSHDSVLGVIQQPVGGDQQGLDFLGVLHHAERLLDVGIFAFLQVGLVEFVQLELQVIVFGGVFGRHLLQVVQFAFEGVVVVVFGLIVGQNSLVLRDVIQQP